MLKINKEQALEIMRGNAIYQLDVLVEFEEKEIEIAIDYNESNGLDYYTQNSMDAELIEEFSDAENIIKYAKEIKLIKYEE